MTTTPLSLLEWQRQMGADEAIPAAPTPMLQPVRSVDEQTREAMRQLERPARAPGTGMDMGAGAHPAPGATPTTTPSQQMLMHPAPALSGGLAEALAQAQALAAGAADMDALRQALDAFDGCGLKRTAKHTVFGDGNPQAKLLFLGEAPGEDEDRQGIPFCGRSGQLLDRMLQAIGLERAKDYFISNSIYWRPPGNRAPNGEELALCAPFMHRMIALIQPRMIVLVGGVAAKALLQQDLTVAQLRRNSPDYVGQAMGMPAVPTRVLYHPAFLLRSPAQKAHAWNDLLALRKQLDSIS